MITDYYRTRIYSLMSFISDFSAPPLLATSSPGEPTSVHVVRVTSTLLRMAETSSKDLL